MISRFFLNMNENDIFTMLFRAYYSEVGKRGDTREINEIRTKQLQSFATALSKPTNGILIKGGVGNGKTTLRRAFCTTMKYLDEKGVFAEDMRMAKKRFDPYLVGAVELSRIAGNDEKYNDIKSKMVLLVDDIGKEPKEIQSYGNIINPIEELIEWRSERQLFTIMTTNLDNTLLQAKYDLRTIDRLATFSQIVWRGTSYRH